MLGVRRGAKGFCVVSGSKNDEKEKGGNERVPGNYFERLVGARISHILVVL